MWRGMRMLERISSALSVPGVGSMLLLAVLSLAGCSGSTGSSISGGTAPTDPEIELGGRWTGRAVSVTGLASPFTATLEQSGSAIEGSFTARSGCIGGGKLEGTRVGDRIDATVTAGDVLVSLTLTVSDDDQLDGTYSLAAGGACPNDQGSVSMSRSAQ